LKTVTLERLQPPAHPGRPWRVELEDGEVLQVPEGTVADHALYQGMELEEAGLVEDAWEYDKYLIDNGCSKKVHAGTHQIPAGAGWEEIMGIITRTGN